jgi:ribosomal protein L21E
MTNDFLKQQLNFRHRVGREMRKRMSMPLSDDLVKKMQKKYEPSSMVQMRFRGNDVAFKTDEDGNPIQLFVGRTGEDGNIKGDRYARTLKYDREGKLIKDHWERKGKAT